MLEIIAAVAMILAIAIAAVLILAATKPNKLRVERTATIKAPAETIFPLINDFRKWSSWSPYENGSAIKRTYGGAESGKSATYAWDGASQRGLRPDRDPRRLGAGKRSSSSSISSRRSRATTPRNSQCCRRRTHPCHLADAWSCELHVQADPGVHQPGQHDRQGFRSRSRQPEEGGREIIDRYRGGALSEIRVPEEQAMQINPYLFYNGNCEEA